ncbi:MAG: acetylglucosamine-6-sulfatase, partial [Planctomycetaceae bacterium]
PHGDGGPDRHLSELYYIEFDPEERPTRIDRPKYQPVVQALQAELAKVMREVGLTAETDKMPVDQGIQQQLPDQKIR